MSILHFSFRRLARRSRIAIRAFLIGCALVMPDVRAHAQTVADAIGGVRTSTPCNCECPQRTPLGSMRVLPQGTTDVSVAISFGAGHGVSTWAESATVRAVLVDVALTHRFARGAAFRAALESTGFSRTLGETPLMLRVSAMVGRSASMGRAYVGVTGYSLRANTYTDGAVQTGGVLGVVRIEAGRLLGPHLVLGGGTGFSPAPRHAGSDGYDRSLGFAGDGQVQVPMPTRTLEFFAVRFVSRWFGNAHAILGEAGLDFVGARSFDGRRFGFSAGYRWTAMWTSPDVGLHGIRLGMEWYGLGADAPRTRVPAP